MRRSVLTLSNSAASRQAKVEGLILWGGFSIVTEIAGLEVYGCGILDDSKRQTSEEEGM